MRMPRRRHAAFLSMFSQEREELRSSCVLKAVKLIVKSTSSVSAQATMEIRVVDIDRNFVTDARQQYVRAYNEDLLHCAACYPLRPDVRTPIRQ